ncbi:hypothetical protein ACOMHN_026606 [Nucella lapillus]
MVSEPAVHTTEKYAGCVEQAEGMAEKYAGSVEQAEGMTEKSVGSVEQAEGMTEKSAGSVEQAEGMTEKSAGSVEQAEGNSPFQMRTVTTVRCSPTPLAPGFTLWTPCIPRKDSDPETSSPISSSSSVLVLLLTWVFCPPLAAARYVELYTGRGWHVLHASSQVMHFLWPPRSHAFALDIARVLRDRCGHYSHVMVHSMSIGAYNYTTCLMLADQEPDLQTYLFSKLRAVVFDSLTLGSLDHMMHGMATGISRWRLVQAAVKSLTSLYFCLMHQHTVETYLTGTRFFRTRPVLVPTLVLSSKDDPMCDAGDMRAMLQEWTDRADFPLSFKVWERSAHCGHLVHHREEYQRILRQFLLSVPSVSSYEGDDQQGEIMPLVSKL